MSAPRTATPLSPAKKSSGHDEETGIRVDVSVFPARNRLAMRAKGRLGKVVHSPTLALSPGVARN